MQASSARTRIMPVLEELYAVQQFLKQEDPTRGKEGLKVLQVAIQEGQSKPSFVAENALDLEQLGINCSWLWTTVLTNLRLWPNDKLPSEQDQERTERIVKADIARFRSQKEANKGMDGGGSQQM